MFEQPDGIQSLKSCFIPLEEDDDDDVAFLSLL